MDLLLWRHAEAEDGIPDLKRKLTARGEKQAAQMAEWIKKHAPKNLRILVSPAARTLQTAEALGRKFRIHPDLGIESTPEKILRAANWPNSREPVLIVGHQPLLGQVASLLLAGEQHDWRIRRGNVWWFAQRERDGVTSNYLRAVMTPELLPPGK